MKRILKILFILTILCLGGAMRAWAEPSNTNSSATIDNANAYTVTPVFGATQNNKTSNFFDMTLTPKQKDTFKLTITNTTPNPQKFKVQVNTATTNSNGIVDYTKSSFEKDPSMSLVLSDLISPNRKDISVPGKQSQTIDFQITMPEKLFSGILLGGVTIRPVEIAGDQSKGGIQNVYMHTIAIRVNETAETIPAKLESGSVKIGQINRHNTVSMEIKNPQWKLLSKVEGDFFVKEKGTNKTIIHEKKNNLSFAPNTRFDLPILLKDSFKPGHYTYTIKLKNHEGNWTFSKDFTINKKQADQYNKRSVDHKAKNLHWLKYLMAFLILVILGTVCYILGKKKGKMRL